MTQLAIPIQQKTIRVLVVDDSALVQKFLARQLNRDPQIEVVGCASNPYDARDRILDLRPDVITLDINMPRMDGITFLLKLMKYKPIPVVVVSSLTQKSSELAMAAFDAGAVEVVCKPRTALQAEDISQQIIQKVKAASLVRFHSPLEPMDRNLRKSPNRNFKNTRDEIVVLGASTGGVDALITVLSALPPNTPPTLVVQHMPPGFTNAFAERLDSCCAMHVKEAQHGDNLRPGMIFIAPGGKHMLLRKCKDTAQFYVAISDGPHVCYQKPSVEALFQSVTEYATQKTVAAILTGMGNDGAKAMLKLRQIGARTIAQDEDTSVVFGMPKEAIAEGGAEFILPLNKIAEKLIAMLLEKKSRAISTKSSRSS